MTVAHWLMKSEPDAYIWDDLVREGHGMWDGVRSHAAARNLRDMAVGDEAFFYHSVIGKEVVGVMRIVEAAFADPTAGDGSPWVAVRVEPVARLCQPVTLATIKADPAMADNKLVRQSRLSVVPFTDEEWAHVLALGKGVAVARK